MNTTLENQKPDIKISVRQTFNLDTEMEVDGLSKKNKYVPEIDNDYKIDRDTNDEKITPLEQAGPTLR